MFDLISCILFLFLGIVSVIDFRLTKKRYKRYFNEYKNYIMKNGEDDYSKRKEETIETVLRNLVLSGAIILFQFIISITFFLRFLY